ncbi:cytochrome P450 9e2-like [Pectinophora gossypiella]|nr:cytochrome P450 9e2-like [Pectinophora gossypiella]
MIIEILIFLLTSLLGFFVYSHWNATNYFKKRGVKCLPGVPIFGNAFNSTVAKKHIVDDLNNVYKAFPGERYVGYIEGTAPIVLIRDPELIKQITVKDFDHFVDHKQFFPEDIEPLFGGSVLMMKGDRWRDMRTTLSPAFTGSKMRQMMPFMTEISNNIVEYLKENVTPNDDLDVGDLVRRYTNDVIASAGFGLQINSLKDKDNEFFKLGQEMFKFGLYERFMFFITAQFPKLTKKLNLKVFPQKTTDFFQNIVVSTIEFREKNGVERPDMIQLLMEASKGNLTHTNEKDNVGFATVDEALKPQGKIRDWTLTELTGQVFIFFVAGFESAATAIVMAIHELAVNPDVQEKLYQEVKHFKETKGNLTYDNIVDLKYLDCVLNETLRKWSAALIMDRVCTKPYELPPPREGGKPFPLKVGDIVYNMVNTIHMDPEYFPEPEKFDPDRFSDENKHNIKPFTFMPFGMGPRNCIGSRFALLELKVLLYSIVLNFKILKGPKTSDPIKLEAADFNIRAVGGTFVRLQERK